MLQMYNPTRENLSLTNDYDNNMDSDKNKMLLNVMLCSMCFNVLTV